MRNVPILATFVIVCCHFIARVSEACFASAGFTWRNFTPGELFGWIGSRDEDIGDTDTPAVLSGDVVTDRAQYAYLARIRSSTKTGSTEQCTGSIITSTVVLTAAHCVVQTTRKLGFIVVTNKNFLITVGDLVTSNTNEGSGTNEITVKGKGKAHPNFPSTGTPVDPYDIAVIQLQTTLTFGTYIQPIALASSSYTVTDGDTAYIAGWGVYQTGSSQASDNLRSGTVRVYKASQSRCLSSSTNHICAAPAATGTQQQICSGDSGGPFMQVLSGTKTLIAVSSYAGIGCTSSNPTMGAIAVAPYLSWISQYTG